MHKHYCIIIIIPSIDGNYKIIHQLDINAMWKKMFNIFIQKVKHFIDFATQAQVTLNRQTHIGLDFEKVS